MMFSILQSLIGNNEHSWGWDLGRNKVYHGKNPAGDTYPKTLSSDEAFVVPDKFLRKSMSDIHYYWILLKITYLLQL